MTEASKRNTPQALGNKLVDSPPNRGGSLGSAGYTFQQYWTLCHLLELHKERKTFLAIIESHDDLVIVDDELAPRAVQFFQVKRRDKTKPWAPSELWKSRKKPRRRKSTRTRLKKQGTLKEALLSKTVPARLSILATAAVNAARFGPDTETFCIVSNGGFQLLVNGEPGESYGEFHFKRIDRSTRLSIVQGLADELNACFMALRILDKLEFRQFPHGEPEDHVLAQIDRYIASTNPYSTSRRAADICLQLMEEIRIRHNYTKKVTRFGHLKRRKAISSRQFAEMLEQLVEYRDPSERWSSIQPLLLAGTTNQYHILLLERAWRGYVVRLRGRRHPQLFLLQAAARNYVRTRGVPQGSLLNYATEAVHSIRAELTKSHGGSSGLGLIQDTDIEAAVLYEITEGVETPQLQDSNQKSQKARP